MPIILDDKKRMIIPRWREIYNKSSSIILSLEKNLAEYSLNGEENFNEKKEDFVKD